MYCIIFRRALQSVAALGFFNGGGLKYERHEDRGAVGSEQVRVWGGSFCFYAGGRVWGEGCAASPENFWIWCLLARCYCMPFKARYTLATKLNSTRSTLLKVDKVDFVSLWPRTHTGNNVDRIGNRSNWTYRQQGRPRQDVKFTLLSICCQNRQQSWTYTATVDFVADLLPISAIVDFQRSLPCWIQLCRQCIPGLSL